MKYLIIMLSLFMFGCSAPIVHTNTMTLTPPPRPVLPTVTGEELSCLSDSAYKALVVRDRLRMEYSEKLEVLLSPLKSP